VELQSGEKLEADSVILATPAFMSAKILASLDPELASDLQSIPYASTATVSLAYKQQDVPRELDGYGYVIPRREGDVWHTCRTVSLDGSDAGLLEAECRYSHADRFDRATASILFERVPAPLDRVATVVRREPLQARKMAWLWCTTSRPVGN
jgi:protoporphyrinogen oxidase